MMVTEVLKASATYLDVANNLPDLIVFTCLMMYSMNWNK